MEEVAVKNRTVNIPGSSARRKWLGYLARVGFMLFFILSVGSLASKPTAKVRASTLPSGFVETLVADALTTPTSMEFAPDGRLFVTQQGGAVRVIKNGALLSTPFTTVPADTTVDRGLMGITFDPNFSANHYVYLYYTSTTPTIHNRLSRFTANGDVAVDGSETVIVDFPTLAPTSTMNIGGSMFFSADGKLFLATGDVEVPSNSQTMGNQYGKILRLNSDGSIPTDNPFYGSASGNNRMIWALGLRNPYTTSIQPGTGRIFANDVGKDGWEEIDEVLPSKNFGWPIHEGASSDTAYQNPLFSYSHGFGPNIGCAITGGAFYNPPTNQFPGQYVGTYFFADYCSGWIRVMDPNNGNTVSDFASGLNYPIYLKVASDGSLYYLIRNSGGSTGQIYKVEYIAAQPPTIVENPVNTLVSDGYAGTFSVSVSGTTPLNYQWQRNDVDITGANAASYTTPPVSFSDDGSHFRCVVTNAFGTATSQEATLSVTSDKPPVGSITQPADGTMYNAGDTITYAGTATDQEDGTLPASAYTWQVDFQHNTHAHGFIPPTSGMTGGTFTIPTSGETSTNTWYRIYLTVTDSVGLTYKTYREIHPRISTITIVSDPPDLDLVLDDTPVSSPTSTTSVVNFSRKIGAPLQQKANGKTWVFDHWSDGGAATHNVSTPATNTTYTATYRDLGPYLEQNGQVVIEAENYDDNISRGSQAWIFRNGLPVFYGTGYMRADPDNNVSYLTPGFSSLSPEMRYRVRFNTMGTYYVWVRVNAPYTSGDTLHVGLDGAEISTSDRIRCSCMTFATWIWTRNTMDGPDATINISNAGDHTINVWMGEDGMRIDRLILTTNASFTPSDPGPNESRRANAYKDTIGVFRPSIQYFLLRFSNTTGPADMSVPFGTSTDLPVVGDWNGDGVDTIGFYRPSTGEFVLRNSNSFGPPDYYFVMGSPGDTPIVGDWNGDGKDGVGVFRPSNGLIYLKNNLTSGFADFTMVLGSPGDVGVAGDWNGDGIDSPGVYRPNLPMFFLSNQVCNCGVVADYTVTLGVVGDVPVMGDWNADGFSGIGVFRPSNGLTYLKNDPTTSGVADIQMVYGVANDKPVAGHWAAGAPSVAQIVPTSPLAPTFVPKK
jgi:glucose/arabinose dehydrogenase